MKGKTLDTDTIELNKEQIVEDDDNISWKILK